MNPPAPSFVDYFASGVLGWERRLEIRGFDIGNCVPVWSNDSDRDHRRTVCDRLFCLITDH
jgi:hypothetical protein